MKKKVFSLVSVLILISTIVYAQINWVTANQKTLVWQTVTTLEDGNPIPAGDVIKYVAWYKLEDGTGITKASGQLDTTSFTFTFIEEGNYILGVSSVRIKPNETVIESSTVSWSDDEAVTSDGTKRGVKYYFFSSNPKGLDIN